MVLQANGMWPGDRDEAGSGGFRGQTTAAAQPSVAAGCAHETQSAESMSNWPQVGQMYGITGVSSVWRAGTVMARSPTLYPTRDPVQTWSPRCFR
ncbi:hypothetical protein SAMN02799620_03052 [Mycolicibacterium fluoranthenivorans]|uniref:Uncharacterized protein n=1 Tax=Mycolicibacterium fluoranthenivorans TaxID=258505 RepID=A0A1G4WF20_9MYCO|nr:hypothetical protein SAMN02799620_03052 [Mycolicibacterium fluoranthenivorans]